MVLTNVPIVDSVLYRYAPALQDDFVPYWNHVYRVLNLCAAIAGVSDAGLEKIAVASVFHDLGIWTDHTFDYIRPSASLAREHLAARSLSNWIPEVEAMIVNHHKITRAAADPHSLVEAFRRADWIDVSRGLRRFGVGRAFIRSLFAEWPSTGFHWRLVELAADRFRHHPLTPLPMLKF